MNKHFNIFKSFSQDDKIHSKIISRYVKIFGNGDFCVFTIKLRRGLRLSHEDCFRILCWVSSHTISLEPYVFTSGVIVDGFFNFRGLFVGINYPRVVCVGSLSERLTKG